ncbi:hypothetical protein LTR82_004217 [Friedmanniomyces endolithicus]|uniref:Uncharacterized protein n=1 Tax=Friedmanniomyces endolithicus TaxID=329885 RepID=A0AAN6FX79_9PEZI|nr:hypothetical protein LTR82_004217 [Friedmanniomyces endolithicus]
MDSIIAAKLVSISSAFILSGYMLSPSQNTLPLLYPQPASVSTVLFRGVFNRGAALVIPVTGLSVAASAYLAYTAPTGSTERTLWAVSGAVTFAMLPTLQIRAPRLFFDLRKICKYAPLSGLFFWRTSRYRVLSFARVRSMTYFSYGTSGLLKGLTEGRMLDSDLLSALLVSSREMTIASQLNHLADPAIPQPPSPHLRAPRSSEPAEICVPLCTRSVAAPHPSSECCPQT